MALCTECARTGMRTPMDCGCIVDHACTFQFGQRTRATTIVSIGSVHCLLHSRRPMEENSIDDICRGITVDLVTDSQCGLTSITNLTQQQKRNTTTRSSKRASIRTNRCLMPRRKIRAIEQTGEHRQTPLLAAPSQTKTTSDHDTFVRT